MARCPHCGGRIQIAQETYQRRMKALGRCPRCGKEKRGLDVRFIVCLKCRIKGAERCKRRYYRRLGRPLPEPATSARTRSTT